jgi:hypothetical protein
MLPAPMADGAGRSPSGFTGTNVGCQDLAPLCRRHHQVKTHGRRRYRHQEDDTYLWTGPFGATYLDTPTGTLRLDE